MHPKRPSWSSLHLEYNQNHWFLMNWQKSKFSLPRKTLFKVHFSSSIIWIIWIIRSILSCHISAIFNKKLLASNFFIILLCEYIFLFSQRLFNFIGNISTSKPKPILVCPAQQFRKNHCRYLLVYYTILKCCINWEHSVWWYVRLQASTTYICFMPQNFPYFHFLELKM